MDRKYGGDQIVLYQCSIYFVRQGIINRPDVHTECFGSVLKEN